MFIGDIYISPLLIFRIKLNSAYVSWGNASSFPVTTNWLYYGGAPLKDPV